MLISKKEFLITTFYSGIKRDKLQKKRAKEINLQAVVMVIETMKMSSLPTSMESRKTAIIMT
jgi:hypothetical protein